jgi:DNA modification methylase
MESAKHGTILCKYDDIYPISNLKLNPKNPNKHSKEQVDHYAKILRSGIRKPVRVSKLSGLVTVGHGHIEASLRNGWTHVPVEYQEYSSPEAEYADMVADNALARQAEIDFAMINVELPDLGPDFDIDLLGIANFEIDPADKGHATGTEDDVSGPPVNARSKIGEVYLLGDHRIMCGDSTDLDQVRTLMRDERASMVFTDPPYNIAYKGGTKKRTAIANDSMVDNAFYTFLLRSYQAMFSVMKPGASIYVCHADTERVNFTKAFIDAGFHLSSVLIWSKNNSTFGRQDYFWKHEPILYGWNSEGPHDWLGPNNEETVWNIDRPSRSDEHPTMKPIALIERALQNSSPKGGLVFDPFGGSGSTLIACEKIGRKCFTMELEPRYVDVILDRWSAYTGQDPMRLVDSKSWSKIRADG